MHNPTTRNQVLDHRSTKPNHSRSEIPLKSQTPTLQPGRRLPTSYLLPHTSYLIPHTSYLIPHTSYLIPHTSYLLPPTSYLLPSHPTTTSHPDTFHPTTSHRIPLLRSPLAALTHSSDECSGGCSHSEGGRYIEVRAYIDNAHEIDNQIASISYPSTNHLQPYTHTHTHTPPPLLTSVNISIHLTTHHIPTSNSN